MTRLIVFYKALIKVSLVMLLALAMDTVLYNFFDLPGGVGFITTLSIYVLFRVVTAFEDNQ